jgi:hypothetical protein
MGLTGTVDVPIYKMLFSYNLLLYSDIDTDGCVT